MVCQVCEKPWYNLISSQISKPFSWPSTCHVVPLEGGLVKAGDSSETNCWDLEKF